MGIINGNLLHSRFWIMPLLVGALTHNAMAKDFSESSTLDILESQKAVHTKGENATNKEYAIDKEEINNRANPQNTQDIESYTQTTQNPSPHTKKLLPPALVTTTLDKDALSSPSSVEFSGKDTPLHSGDVAKSLLLVPGFSMVRKGGGGSEVIYRSQGASRLPIFLSGGLLNGACGGRMDTTITYTFPENYDKISIFKGPQDVRYGALIAGGILFERDVLRLSQSRFKAGASLLYGSFNRLDFNAYTMAGGRLGSLQVIGSYYASDDYRSGDGALVHSAYNRRSVSVIGTLTPTKNSALELDIDIGRGFASYADRGMDARTFDRNSYALKYQQHFNSSFELLDIRAWHTQIDHIMDNFSHRPTSPNAYSLSNPKRQNSGTRIEGRIYPSEDFELYVGGSYMHDYHALRKISKAPNQSIADEILSSPYKPNFSFDSASLFAQGSYLPQSTELDSSYGLFFGTRYDFVLTQKLTSSESTSNHLGSGFVRYERYFDNLSAYTGLGIAQRAGDFWERSKAQGMALRAETNSQLDIGLSYKSKSLWWRLSGYGAYINDYILLHYGKATNAHNTDAMFLGAEMEGEYIWLDSVHLYGSLAYTYAQNLRHLQGAGYALKNGDALPQIAPLQGQISLFYTQGGYLLRLDSIFNAAQERYVLDFGNVIGKDLGATKGFMLLNLYGGYSFKHISLFFGIDNLTNTHYAYHLSKNGIDIGALGIEATRRVYEPGRSYWGKIKMSF